MNVLPRKFIPDYFMVLGMIVMPLACSFNIGIMAFLVGERSASFLAKAMLLGLIFGLLLCFPLGIASSKTMRLWQAGGAMKARLLGVVCGCFACLCLWPYIAPNNYPLLLVRKALLPGAGGEMAREWLLTVALLILPLLWSVLLIVTPLLARTPPSPTQQP